MLTPFTPHIQSLSAWRSGLCAAAIVLLVAIVYWPGVHGYWGRDDFYALAFSRLLDTPWRLFVQDHFPVPGSIFRPLGFASLWICEALFGSNYRAHAIVDLLLHAGVALALFGLLRRVDVPRAVALLCTLLFALYPAAIGTALWWSARFDLLATLFVLLAMQAAFAYRDKQRFGALAATLVAALAAMLAKEIGLVAIAAVSLIWLRWAWVDPTQRARALRAAALCWLCAVTYLGWRWAVLGTWSSAVTVQMPMQQAIAQGMLSWLQQAPGYLTFWSRMAAPGVWTIAIAMAAAVIIGGATITLHRAQFEWRRHIDLALCGVCVLVLPAVLQAPIAAFAAPLSRESSAIEAAMQSRLYYLGIAGAMAALAAVLATLWKPSSVRLRILLALPLMLAALTFADVSRHTARSFAQRSKEISSIAREAVAAVARLDLPPARCQVSFLDIAPPPEWSIYVSMDSIIKALTPDIDHVKHCWFHSNYGTTVYLQPAPAAPSDALPYLPFELDGIPVPWRTLGNVEIAYLRPPENGTAAELAGIRFLRYRDHHFEEVSADAVARGDAR